MNGPIDHFVSRKVLGELHDLYGYDIQGHAASIQFQPYCAIIVPEYSSRYVVVIDQILYNEKRLTIHENFHHLTHEFELETIPEWDSIIQPGIFYTATDDETKLEPKRST